MWMYISLALIIGCAIGYKIGYNVGVGDRHEDMKLNNMKYQR